MIYALIGSDNQISREISDRRLDLTAGVRGGYRWVPVEISVDDQSTQSRWTTLEPQVVTVEANRVTKIRVKRDMTAQEIEAEQTQLVMSEADKALGKALFKLLNDFRASQGQPPVTREQFLAWLKAQI